MFKTDLNQFSSLVGTWIWSSSVLSILFLLLLLLSLNRRHLFIHRGHLDEWMLKQLGGGWPLILIVGQTLPDEVLALFGEVVGNLWNFAGDYFIEELSKILDIRPRMSSCCKFDHSTTKGPNIASSTHFNPFNWLGRHPEDASLDVCKQHARLWKIVRSEALLQLLGVILEDSWLTEVC